MKHAMEGVDAETSMLVLPPKAGEGDPVTATSEAAAGEEVKASDEATEEEEALAETGIAAFAATLDGAFGDDDGYLEGQEPEALLPVQPKPPAPVASTTDWNQLFTELDENHDGRLSQIEIIRRINEARKQDDRSFLARISKVLGLPDHVKQQDGSRDIFERVFQAMDQDEDKEITLDEFQRFCALHVKQSWACLDALISDDGGGGGGGGDAVGSGLQELDVSNFFGNPPAAEGSLEEKGDPEAHRSRVVQQQMISFGEEDAEEEAAGAVVGIAATFGDDDVSSTTSPN